MFGRVRIRRSQAPIFLRNTSTMAAVVTPSRLTALVQARCAIFKTAYNPTSTRTGAKYFRARLRGPSMVNYYPQDIDLSMSKFAKEWPELELVNFAEAQRLWDVDMKKARGKGAPTKAKDKSMCLAHVVPLESCSTRRFQARVVGHKEDGSCSGCLDYSTGSSHIPHHLCRAIVNTYPSYPPGHGNTHKLSRTMCLLSLHARHHSQQHVCAT